MNSNERCAEMEKIVQGWLAIGYSFAEALRQAARQTDGAY